MLEPRDHARSALAGLFWPEMGEQYARAHLRNTLYQLRQTLDQALSGGAIHLRRVARPSVCFQPDQATVDARRFQALLRNTQTASAANLAQLEELMEFYQGELFLGFAAANAPAFEE